MLRGNTPGSVRCSQLHFQCCHWSIADLRCAPLAMEHHSLNAHIEWVEYTAWHYRHVQVAINDEKQKRMINRDLYGLRLRAGVAWPGEGSSYCTFVLAASMMLLLCSAAIATAGGAQHRCASMRRGVLQQQRQQKQQQKMQMQRPLTFELIDGMRTNVDVNGLLNVSHIDAFLISHGSEVGTIWLEYITAATRRRNRK